MTSMTMSFHHLSVQRRYLVQVTIRFYKKEFDYIDVVKKKSTGTGSQKSYIPDLALWLFSSVNLEKWSNISGPQSVHLPGDEPQHPLRVHGWKSKGSSCGNSKANGSRGMETTGTIIHPHKELVGHWLDKFHQRTFICNF